MRVLNVAEFANWQLDAGKREYILDSDNSETDPLYPVQFLLRFPAIIVSWNSNRILFQNDRDSLCFRNVKEVHMISENEGIGTVFDIVCADLSNSTRGSDCENVRSYRFLAD